MITSNIINGLILVGTLANTLNKMNNNKFTNPHKTENKSNVVYLCIEQPEGGCICYKFNSYKVAYNYLNLHWRVIMPNDNTKYVMISVWRWRLFRKKYITKIITTMFGKNMSKSVKIIDLL